jgi:1-phosphofructokinase
MIITVSLNPALDKTARVDVFRANALNRLKDVVTDPGGKGVNVSGVLKALGAESIATGFAGGSPGQDLLKGVAGAGIKADFIEIAGTTRTNLKIVDAEGSLTECNESGPVISGEEWALMEQKLESYAKAGNTFVLSGSLPGGLGEDAYQKLCASLKLAGASVFLDADGKALSLALGNASHLLPDYIKPNRFELLNCFGMEDDGSAGGDYLASLCVRLLDRGIKLVALSMGSEGALFFCGEGAWKAAALPVTVKSTVGAGDSMVAALCYGLDRGMKKEDCFRLAVAVSAAACTTEGTKPPDKAAVDALLEKVNLQKF